MPVTLTFDYSHDYGARAASGIVVPVKLTVGEREVSLFPKLDTGAECCIFKREYGEGLDLDIESGQAHRLFTVRGEPIPTFGHEVMLSCLGCEFLTTVYFAAEPEFPRDVVGRRGWLQQLRLAILDYDSVLHASYYNH